MNDSNALVPFVPQLLTTSQITYNREQEAAIEMGRWLSAAPYRVGVLAGPAGTGKSTTLRGICDAIGEVHMVAPTNRAAMRASHLSGRPAQTNHSYLYEVRDVNGVPTFSRRKYFERPKSGVIVMDESSMLGFDVMKDLWPVMQEANVSFLFVGDSFQLPPVTKDGEPEFSVFTSSFEEFVKRCGCEMRRVDLVKVMRQKGESPILDAATAMRENPRNWSLILEILESDHFPKPTNVPVRLAAMVDDGIDHACICYTNATRQRINRDVRKVRGWTDTDDINVGEPLLVRRNQKSLGISNGEVIRFEGFVDHRKYVTNLPQHFQMTTIKGALALVSRDGIFNDQNPPFDQRKGLRWPFVEANFGYAMTCHASQGSEFEWVMLHWEPAISRMPMPFRTRWLYTCITRAKEKFMVGGLP